MTPLDFLIYYKYKDVIQKNKKRGKIYVTKKILKLMIIFSFLTMLTSCINRQSNYFVEGVFKNDEYKLVITVIDYETFINNEGRNVVIDESYKNKNHYFEILLYKIDNEKELELTFNDLTLQTVTTAEPCSYLDKSGNSITPHIHQQGISYGIVYNNEIINFRG